MNDKQARSEHRRRAQDGDPVFKAGDVVMVKLWHEVCWVHSSHENPDTWTLEALPKSGGMVSGGRNKLVGVRLDGTRYNRVDRGEKGYAFKNEFCCHDEHWTLVRPGPV